MCIAAHGLYNFGDSMVQTKVTVGTKDIDIVLGQWNVISVELALCVSRWVPAVE
jgi:hypothetical protein